MTSREVLRKQAAQRVESAMQSLIYVHKFEAGAVEYLDDFGLVDTSKTLGTFPFRFSRLIANRRTRQFIASS